MPETKLQTSAPTALPFACFDPKSDAREAMHANFASGETILASDLIRVKTPAAGGKKWTLPLDSGNVEVDAIEGILCHVQRQGVIWRSDELDGSGSPPILISRDLIEARNEFNADMPKEMAAAIEPALLRVDAAGPVYAWDKLPYTQWGSGKKGVGKRAKEQRILFLLPRDSVFPLVVTCQPGSLRNVTSFIKRLPVPFYRAVISLSLETAKSKGGINYSRIVPKLVSTLTVEEGDYIRSTYTQRLSRAAATMGVEADHGDAWEGDDEG